MQCPLCRKEVSDENELQIHYLMSCSGYVGPRINKTPEVLRSRSSKTKVQFRWVKSKPTLAREVHLISSLAGSLSLVWNVIEECFLSEPTEVLNGLHACQIVVDGDAMSTENFEITDRSRIVDVMISEGSLEDGSSGTIPSSQSDNVQEPPAPTLTRSGNHRRRIRTNETRTTGAGKRSTKGSLYEEMIKHQILHGDSLGELTDGSQTSEGGLLNNVRRRGNGLSQSTNGDNDFQQFLQPSVTGNDNQDPAMNEASGGGSGINHDDGHSGSDNDGDNDVEDLDLSSNPEHPEDETLGTGDRVSLPPVDNLGGLDDGEQQQERLETDGNEYQDNRVGRDNEVSPSLHHNEEIPDIHHHEETQDVHHHEETPDIHHHEETLDAHHHEETPDVHHHGGTPDVHHHEETPVVHNDHEIPEVPHHDETMDVTDHGETLHADDHEQIQDEHEQVRDEHEHEEPLHSRNHEEILRSDDDENIRDGRNGACDQEEEGPVDHDLISREDTQVEQRDSTVVTNGSGSFSLPSSHEPFLLPRERPTGEVDSRTQISARSFGNRTPVGGNEEGTAHGNRSSQVDISLFEGENRSTSTSTALGSSVSRNLADVTYLGGRYSLPGDLLIDTSARRTPPGSVFGDREIRHLPSYTTAPSRPFSSLPYTRQHLSAISPLISPREAEGSGTSSERPGSGSRPLFGDTVVPRSEQYQTSPSRSAFDRQTPTGSARTVDTSPPVSSSSQPPASEVWSDDRIKELLDSLKEPRKRRNDRSSDRSVSPRERPASSEKTALKALLAEREAHIEKLQKKIASFEKEFVKLRSKEIELAKALSLAETHKAAAKEQEDIVGQVTQALNTKETECSELRATITEMKRTQQLLQREMESMKNVHDIRIQELRSMNDSLTEEVEKARTLRQDSRSYSSDYVEKYKKLLEDYSESRAVNASLEDQVKLLENQKQELRRKVEEMSTQIEVLNAEKSAKHRKTYYPSTSDPSSAITSDSNSRSSALNGYIATGDVTRYISRRQPDSGPGVRQRIGADSGNYDLFGPLRQEDRSRTTYKSRISGTDRHDFRVERHDGYSSPSLSRFALESYPHDFTANALRRKSSTDDTASADVSGIEVDRYLHTRSYSSDCFAPSSSLQNGISVGYQSRSRTKVRENYSQDDGEDSRKKHRKRRERPHSYHSGSRDNLYGASVAASRSASSPASRIPDFAVTGYHVDSTTSHDSSDVSPTSHARSSRERGKPFAPSTPQELDHGMTVLVTRACGKIGRGEVKYIGRLPTRRDTIYLGLELDKEDGKHNGEFNGQRFFKCKPNRGIFVPFAKVVMAYT